MADLDQYVTTLRGDLDRVELPGAGDIRRRGERRRTRRVAGLAAFVVILLALTGIGADMLRGRSTPNPNPEPGGPAPVAPTASSNIAAMRGNAIDASFVTPFHGFVLLADVCPGDACRTLVSTEDGGRSWSALAPLPDQTLTAIRFFNEKVGYAFGPDGLYRTEDGGGRWVRNSTMEGITDLAVGPRDSGAIALTTGCRPGCPYTLLRGPATIDGLWRPVTLPGPSLAAARVALVRTDQRAFIAAFVNAAGGAAAVGELLSSADDGLTWSRQPDPCAQGTPAGTADLIAAGGGAVAIACVVRGQAAPPFVLLSTDVGVTWSERRVLPGDHVTTLGLLAPSTIFAAAGATLYYGDNMGTSWLPVGHVADYPTSGPIPTGRIAFQTSKMGFWLPGTRTVLTTVNGGVGWTANRFG